MDTNYKCDSITHAIRKHLETEIAGIIDVEVAAAKLNVEKKIRALIPQVATAMLDRFTIERPYGGPELVIRVDISTEPKVK